MAEDKRLFYMELLLKRRKPSWYDCVSAQVIILYLSAIAYIDRRGSTMNSVTILYNIITCAMRRFCVIGFLLPIHVIYIYVWTRGGCSNRFSYNKNNNAQTAQFRYVLLSVCMCVCVPICASFTERQVGVYIHFCPLRSNMDTFSVLQILKRHISIMMHCEYIILYMILVNMKRHLCVLHTMLVLFMKIFLNFNFNSNTFNLNSNFMSYMHADFIIQNLNNNIIQCVNIVYRSDKLNNNDDSIHCGLYFGI